MNTIYSYIKLMRLNKPIGILLLLWPTAWALWLANQGTPSLNLIIIFFLGTCLMRSAGCVINDIADRKLDAKVKRTLNRPLVTGEVSLKHSIVLFITLLLTSASLLFFLNNTVLYWAVVGAILAIVYPFCKRFIATPQLMLGFAFSWGIPLVFLSSNKTLTFPVFLLMTINFLWIICYDTYYAMVDLDDDIVAGIRSTAVFFGNKAKLIILTLQFSIAILWLLIARLYSLTFIFYPLFFSAHLLFVYQAYLTLDLKRESYFKAFLNNHWYGIIMWLAIALSLPTF